MESMKIITDFLFSLKIINLLNKKMLKLIYPIPWTIINSLILLLKNTKPFTQELKMLSLKENHN